MKRKTRLKLERKFNVSHEVHTKQIDKILWNDFIEQGNLRNYTFRDIKIKLNTIKFHIEALYNVYRKEDSIDNYEDNRSGYETYGYKDIESILNTLSYISDKYKCTFRLKWILDLLNIKQVKEK